jgi:hypothetical protein
LKVESWLIIGKFKQIEKADKIPMLHVKRKSLRFLRKMDTIKAPTQIARTKKALPYRVQTMNMEVVTHASHLEKVCRSKKRQINPRKTILSAAPRA